MTHNISIESLFLSNIPYQIKNPFIIHKALILKRIIDFIVSLVLFIFLLPFLLLIALFVWFYSMKNPFFMQKRIGCNGHSFTIFKFRTLKTDDIKINSKDEISDNDPRITDIGRFLRRYKIDELPQLFNVILGDMSLIGPRPDLPEQVALYKPSQFIRLAIKPGLSCVAQISGNIYRSWDERIEFDRWYIKNWHLLLDVKIIMLTLISIIKGESPDSDPLHLYGLVTLNQIKET
jgi:undecaprenyl phosphate N,N'-diacetylbacillosamine 1-phosphate transferase